MISTLVLGGATETVDVTDATPLLETERTSFAQAIDEAQVQTLPINGRNYTSLAALTPGISTTPRTNINPGGTYDVGATFSSGGVQYAAGGVSEGSRDNGYYVNGVNVNENYQSSISFQPSAEAISEVKIGVADFSAEYGRASGGIVNVGTIAGTNEFHGTGYEFNRFSKLASNGFRNVPQCVLKLQNQQYSCGFRRPDPPVLSRRVCPSIGCLADRHYSALRSRSEATAWVAFTCE